MVSRHKEQGVGMGEAIGLHTPTPQSPSCTPAYMLPPPINEPFQSGAGEGSAMTSALSLGPKAGLSCHSTRQLRRSKPKLPHPYADW